jgi:dTDP-4-amino-4,6-dideoxygalactose transaminase
MTAPRFAVNWSGRGSQYTEDEIATVVEAMRAADPQTQGRFQAAFERDFRTRFQVPHAFAVSSCTAALELAALISQVGPGDEVIVPAHTFAASAIPFARTGARLVWADMDPATRLVTAETLRPLITDRTRVLVVVHLYGLVCDMDPILALAEAHGLLVVEDVAQAIGVGYKGRPAGSMGHFGCFSFHTHKNITTLGEGGMLTVRDDAHAALVPGLRHNGMRSYDGERPRYWLPAMTNVDFDLDGVWPYNFCLGEVQCALGSRMLERLDHITATRAARAEAFQAALSDFPEMVFQSRPEGCGHAHHLMAVRYDGRRHPATGNRHRDELMTLLAEAFGIKVVVQYCPLYRYPLFARGGFGAARCPHADEFFDAMISFPFHQWMPDTEFATMIAATTAALTRLRGETA